MSTKMNVGVWTAVITAAGGIAAALIASYGHPGPEPPGPEPTLANSNSTSTSSTPTPGSGVIRVSADSVAAYVYGSPVSDPTSDRVGELSDGQQVQIVCTVQGPTTTGSLGTSTVWDKIPYNHGDAYISDTEVATASNQPQARTCP
jgi:hypothetical protein